MRKLLLGGVMLCMASVVCMAQHPERTYHVPGTCSGSGEASGVGHFGLPISGPASPMEQGRGGIGAALTLGADSRYYGSRFSYNVLNILKVFGDIGKVEPDQGDAVTSFQGGAQLNIRAGLPFACAIAGAVALPDVDGADVMQVSVAVNGSGSVEAIPDLDVYGSLGLAHGRWETDGGAKDDSTELTAAAGAVKSLLAGAVTVFAEVSYIDDLFASIGGTWNW